MALETMIANICVAFTVKLGPVFRARYLFLEPRFRSFPFYLCYFAFSFYLLFPFSLYLLTFLFFRTLTENGEQVAVHVCTEHHIGVRIDSQLRLLLSSELWQQGWSLS
jgi:hypothetical protein